MKNISFIILSAIVCGAPNVAYATEAAMSSSDDYDLALAMLRQALVEQSGFTKVRAAEALLGLNYNNEVLVSFQSELQSHSDDPYFRTGIYRVLARGTFRREARQQFVDRLRDIYFDDRSPDRVQALEALAKLGYIVPHHDRMQFERSLPGLVFDEEPYLRWVLANSGDPEDVRSLAAMLNSDDGEVRALAAYALRHIRDRLPEDVVRRLREHALMEFESPACIYVLSAAFVTTPDATTAEQFKGMLLALLETAAPKERLEIAQSLAERGTLDDVKFTRELLNDSDADVRIGASYALQRIDRRQSPPLRYLDWAVMGVYALGMLAVGWHFSKRNTGTDEYLLAGRAMKALPVGLSYFATLFSTVTYLSLPGEVAANGPVVLGAILSFPLVFVIVGYLLIPYFMRLKVTSAYEVLEQRFGLSVRMFGSGIFLAMRFTWMAMILFGMSRIVLVPLLGLDVSATPWVAAGLGLTTVAYTSMGGLKAVIWTDVAQTMVLMSGTLLSIAMISFNLGGFEAWWPDTWPENWETPQLGFDTNARLTIASVALSQFTWYVCTAGSDQMAVQRYLATGNGRSARRMFGISLLCDAFVAVLLVLLGIALFAYYTFRPDLLPDNESIISGADQLLPRYIVKGLPDGISGIVIAGLAAAAMSSLSSGVNSTCSVISVDWIERFRTKPLSKRGTVRVARLISWIIGAFIVVLSMLAIVVPGNLLELAYKLVNLFVAPLFVLFFMAMFVPGATSFSAWAAGLSSMAAAVIIAYTEYTKLSFIWIMPVSLATGIAVGCLIAALPIGERRQMLEVKGAGDLIV